MIKLFTYLSCHFAFILFAKVNFENRSRKDFIKSLKLDSNRKLMRQTLKRYFGGKLTEKNSEE